jgi:hypothetical protein
MSIKQMFFLFIEQDNVAEDEKDREGVESGRTLIERKSLASNETKQLFSPANMVVLCLSASEAALDISSDKREQELAY